MESYAAGEAPLSARRMATERARLLDFGADAPLPLGGFGWLDDAGRPLPDRPAELWISARMTHVHAVGHLLGREGSDALADRGLEALHGLFHDDTHGGWWAQVGESGPVTRAKTAYEHAFVVLAAASATAAGRPTAPGLLEEAVEVLTSRFWDDDAGMVVEEWDESWTVLDDYRGLNANMHAVEALLAAADTLHDDGLRARALRITTRVVRDLAPAYEWRLPEHFGPDWSPRLDYNAETPAHPFRPYGATVGHWLEWARLSLHLRASLGAQAPAWLLDHARALVEAAVSDGWGVDGAPGFVYTVDFDGRPVVRQRMHWVLAEGVAAAAALHHATGEERYADLCSEWWSYAERYLIDRSLGSWHHELGPDNLPSSGTWAGKPDLYHAIGATLVSRLPLAPSLAVALRDGLLSPPG